jgi:DNA-binding MarR family transcriptional regulator
MRGSVESDSILPRILRETFVALIRREEGDLTSRQFAVFLICYVEEGPHTVARLAERTRLPKAAISRVLDRLGALGLTQRRADPRDRRSVLVSPTPEGFAFLRLVRGILDETSAALQPADGQDATVPTTGTDGM